MTPAEFQGHQDRDQNSYSTF